ncbi:unnamed protein product [Calypogeia fissa]
MKGMMAGLTREMRNLSVNIATSKASRRPPPPPQRYNVWCTTCKKMGHYPHECPTLKNINYLMSEEGPSEESEIPFDYLDTTYQVQAAPPPVQYFPTNPPRVVSAYNRPVSKPPMAPPGGYPPRSQLPRGVCWNCGAKDHFSPQCPWPKREEGYTPLCGNCGKEGHLQIKCPYPAKPKMVVRYVKEPPKEIPKPGPKVRLVYYEEEEVNQCLLVQDFGEDLVSKVEVSTQPEDEEDSLKGVIFDKDRPYLCKKEERGQPNKKVKERDRILNVFAATRSKEKRLEKALKKEPRKQPEKISYPEEGVAAKPTEDGAYDRSHPKYFLPDISPEVKEMLQEELGIERIVELTLYLLLLQLKQ